MYRIVLGVFLGVVLAVSAGAAQDSLAWKPTADVMLTLTQNAYSDNWAGGDVGSVTWVGSANLGLERQFTAPWHWRNTLKLAYGQTHNQERDSKDWKKPFKSTDLIDFESLLRYQIWSPTIEPYAAFRLITQFEDATYDNYTQHFNPIDLTESVGASKTLYKKDEDEFMGRFGFGFRQRIMRIPDSTFTSTTTESSNDGGLEFVLDGKYHIPTSQILWTTKLTTFKAFFYSKSDELTGLPHEDYWKAVDVNWENTFSAQVSKYLAVSLYIQWLYDKEIDKGGRFKETLSLNFTWKLL
jgi:hypothetical protein